MSHPEIKNQSELKRWPDEVLWAAKIFKLCICTLATHVSFLASASAAKPVWWVPFFSSWWKKGEKRKCKEDSEMGGRNGCIFVIAVEPVALPSFINSSWLLVSVEWADRMWLLQPLPSEIGPPGPRVGKGLKSRGRDPPKGCSSCHVLRDSIYPAPRWGSMLYDNKAGNIYSINGEVKI